jgi:hypothetical protein
MEGLSHQNPLCGFTGQGSITLGEVQDQVGIAVSGNSIFFGVDSSTHLAHHLVILGTPQLLGRQKETG